MEESQVTLDCMGQVSELSNPRQLQMSLFDLTLAGAGQLLQETQDEGLEEVDLIGQWIMQMAGMKIYCNGVF